jgi:hypothetical protein
MLMGKQYISETKIAKWVAACLINKQIPFYESLKQNQLA